jgi:SAM-dependent methyltransferase
MKKRYTDYDRFAWVYNKHWGNTFTLHALSALEQLVLPHVPANASILDLCCGTGQLAQVLTAKGYMITGADGSEEMLQYARQNAPTVKFVLADARSFKLPDTYHAVISTFDSLNHIMSLDELTSVFRNVHAVLKEGGLFLFDLNMEDSYRATWGDSFGIVEDDHVCVIQTGYSPGERTAKFDATIFRLEEGSWQRSELALFQKCYSQEEVQSALETAGFTQIQARSYDEKTGFGELAEDSERAVFVCRKPPSQE